MAAKIKRGDEVVAITGRHQGLKGKVESVNPKTGKAIVTGMNTAVVHRRQTENQRGGRIAKNLPIELSNLALVDPKDSRPTRVGFRFEGDRKVRYSKRTGAVIDV
ncbi:MAG: 50S ribosomal protein L24 [Rhodobacteraceae bacterium]|nr:50S ribosomal protein L24 [Paracoccaceae bacterium]